MSDSTPSRDESLYWKGRKAFHRLRTGKPLRPKPRPKPIKAPKQPPCATEPGAPSKAVRTPRPPRFAECNRTVADSLRRSDTAPLLLPLRQAFLAIYDDATHPHHHAMTTGRHRWFDPVLGLNDLAIDCGRSALAARDLVAARTVGHFIHLTGSSGPVTMAFLANCAAANGEWGAAADFYRRSARRDQPLIPNSLKWENRERIFYEIDRMLRDIDVDFINLSPVRSTGSRMQALDVWWKAMLSAGKLARPEFAPILGAIAELRSQRIDQGPLARAARDVSSLTLAGFRNYVAGKSICLVANSGRLLEHRLGETIDSYDIVMRFNSFVISPPHTGCRTDIHVAVHLYEYNLTVPVDVRILVSGRVELWQNSVHDKIRPGKQRLLGDRGLSWPARDLGLIDPKHDTRTPTAGFNMLRLLHHLDVSTKIDLIAFDFYSSGMLRIDEARQVAHSDAHNSIAEKEWTLSNARQVGDTIIAMR